MFGEEIGYNSTQAKESSDAYNADVDRVVKKILDESFERVSLLLTKKDKELRRLSKYLYQHDYLDSDEMERII
jgi:ATP-dependent Zn protease